MEIVRTDEFDQWMADLRDRVGKAKILVRIDRLAAGNPGNVEPVGKGVSEMRLTYGPGYRVYYIKRGELLVVLLCGGDKSTQDADIKRAHRLADNL